MIYYIIILILFLLLLLLLLLEKKSDITNNCNCIENFYINNNIEIVIARYNENLEWLAEEPFYKYPIICYNSGNNDDFLKLTKMKVIQINNIGKEAYVYLYHIINNYNNLSNITIFLPGSSSSYHKIENAKRQIYETEKYNNTVFFSVKYNNVRDDIYDFQIDDWCSTSNENTLANPKCELNLAKIRPFGKWFDKYFEDININYINYFGILGLKKKHIIQNSKEYYENLLLEFEQPNDEVAHYFERAWEAIFYPLDDAIFIELQL
jgi:hypothetical protein